MDYVIRRLTDTDAPILWEMLYYGLHRGDESPPPDIVQRPEFSRFVEGWGRVSDAGFVAHDGETNEPLGAVWFRLPSGDATPELAFVVKPGQRRRGIGAALLTQWVRANPEQSTISLRVRPNNPAVRLYERFGFKIAQQSAEAVTMQRQA